MENVKEIVKKINDEIDSKMIEVQELQAKKRHVKIIDKCRSFIQDTTKKIVTFQKLVDEVENEHCTCCNDLAEDKLFCHHCNSLTVIEDIAMIEQINLLDIEDKCEDENDLELDLDLDS